MREGLYGVPPPPWWTDDALVQCLGPLAECWPATIVGIDIINSILKRFSLQGETMSAALDARSHLDALQQLLRQHVDGRLSGPGVTGTRELPQTVRAQQRLYAALSASAYMSKGPAVQALDDVLAEMAPLIRMLLEVEAKARDIAGARATREAAKAKAREAANAKAI